MSKEDLEELQAAIDRGNLSAAASKVQKSLELSKNAKLDIAIMGETGVGKSSFINAIRGLEDDDEGAAKVCIFEMTMVPTAYSLPKHPNVRLWDLPGIGTPRFWLDTYLQQFNFSRYNCFIIITSERFKYTHAILTQKIQRMGKKFYFVRSKVDMDLCNERRKKNFSQEGTLQRIRNDCIESLERQGVSSPQVFLISRWEFDQYDAPRLQKTLAPKLDAHKRHVFLLALPDIFRLIFERKTKALQGQVRVEAQTISASLIPGLPIACVIPQLMDCMASYCKMFGLDDDSLVNLAQQVGKPVVDLKAVIKSTLGKAISSHFTLNLLAKARADCMTRTRRILSAIPLVGGLVEAQMDFLVTCTVLQHFLDNVAEDAQRVLIKALEAEKKKGVQQSQEFNSPQAEMLKGAGDQGQKSLTHWKKEMDATGETLSGIFQDLDVKLPGMSEKDVEELKAAIETGNLSEAAQKAQEALELSKNTELNIAITGESGSGKSSFVNAMLGLADDEEGAAEVGITETTTEAIAYLHPTLPNVKMWDLPGIGTPSFRPDTYLQQVGFARYDFFIIVTSKRFRSCDADLAQEIQEMGKKFYFVRSKVDEDLRNESRKRNYDRETTLQTIRDDCVERLRSEGVSSPQVFLISRWDFDQYDSPQLQETLANELDSHKRHVFLLALPNISRPILDKKKEALKNQVWKRALKSCAIAAVPIPHLSVSCDVDILVESMTEYCKVFGLDEESLVKLSKQVRKPVSQLRDVIKTPLVKEISREDALELLSKVTDLMMRFKLSKPTHLAWEQGDKETVGTMIGMKKNLSLLLGCGTLLAMKISFQVTNYSLHCFLEGVADDAHRVLTEALEVAEKKSV